MNDLRLFLKKNSDYPMLEETVRNFISVKIQLLLILVLVMLIPNMGFTACQSFQDSTDAKYELARQKYLCENEYYSGGGTFQGYVQYIDSLGYPNGYYCNGIIVNQGNILFYTCNTCTSSEINDSLYRDTLECNRICKQSNLSCIYSFGDEASQYYGTAYPSCGATDSTIVGCEELESSSSTEEGSSSSGEGEGGEDEESSSSCAGGGGEEGSSSSGETINPGEDEDDGGFICNYFSPGNPFDFN